MFARHLLLAFMALLALAIPSTVLAQEATSSTVPLTDLTQKNLELPAPIDDLIVGGSGKFLIAHLKAVQKLAIVDVAAVKVAKYISLPDNNILFAAGAEKLYVIYKDQHLAQRYSLASFERELSVQIPDNVELGTLTMGHAALAPILLGGISDSRNGLLLDPTSLTTKVLTNSNRNRNFRCSAECIIRASANGQVFTSWRPRSSPSGFDTLVMNGDTSDSYDSHESKRYLSPNYDGSRIFTYRGAFNFHTAPIGKTLVEKAIGHRNVPSVTGDYYVKYLRSEPVLQNRSNLEKPQEAPSGAAAVTIHSADDDTALMTITGAVSVATATDRALQGLHEDRRVLLFPNLNSLVVVGESEKSLNFITVNMEELLRKAGTDYLFVSSTPQLSVEPGKPYSYSVVVRSKRPGVKIELASGPEGMQVDASGNVTWTPPAHKSVDTVVILAITNDANKEIFHSFRLSGQPDPTAATAAKPEEAVTTPADHPSATAPTTFGALPPITPAKLSAERMQLQLPAPTEKLVVGGGGRYLIAHLKSLRKIAIIDVCETKITGYIPADDDNIHFAAGADKLVVVLGGKSLITRWDLVTLKRELTLPTPETITDVIMGCASAGPLLMSISAPSHGQNSGENAKFIDLARFETIRIAVNSISGKRQNDLPYFQGRSPQVSSDGRTFCAMDYSDPKIGTFDGECIRVPPSSPSLSTGVSGPYIPAPDGQVIYSRQHRLSPKLHPLISGEPHNQSLFVPATHGRFYLSVVFSDKPNESFDRKGPALKQKVLIFQEGDSRHLATIDDVQLVSKPEHAGNLYGFQANQRIVFVPAAHVIAYLGPRLDVVELRKFDLDAALEASGTYYFFVTSLPPTTAKPGETITYQLAAKAKLGGVTYRLESGPEGMAIDKQGLITWKVPANARGLQSVIVVVNDAGKQELFHTFSIQVQGNQPEPEMVAERPVAPDDVRKADFPEPSMRPRSVPPANVAENRTPDDFPRQAGDPPPRVPGNPPPAASNRPNRRPFEPLIGKQHVWTDANTGRTLEGTFVACDGTKVQVRTPKEGKTIEIPLDRLSREDLIWLLNGK